MRLSVIIIITYFFLALIVDVALWFLQPRQQRIRLRIPFFLFNGCCMLLLIVSMIFPWRNVESSLVPKMWLLYIWLSLFIIKFNIVVWCVAGLIPRLWHGRNLRLGVSVGLPLGLLCAGIMWWGALCGRRLIDVERIDIVSPRVPENFNGFRIAQISDLHLGTWGDDTSFVSEFVDSVNALDPDIIFFTGDIVNRDASELKPFVPVLRRLKAHMGVLSVMGNHDYGSYGDWPSREAENANEQRIREIQRSLGWKMLENEHLTLRNGNDSIVIIGVENWGEPPFPSYGDFDRALISPVDSGSPVSANGREYKILLTHNPEHWRRHIRHESNTDLTLSGHTHGMQLQIRMGDWRWSPASWRYPTWGGLYSTSSGNSLLYVNIGAGEVGLPFRIGASPEITFITLRSSGKATPATIVR